MSGLALVLLGAGVADLVSRRSAALVIGPLVVVFSAALAGLFRGPSGITMVVLCAVAVAAWGWLWREVEARGGERRRWVPLPTFLVMLLVPVVGAGWLGPVGGPVAAWMSWAGAPWAVADPTRVLLVLALVPVQVNTANVLVRSVLAWIGALPAAAPSTGDPPRAPEPALRGGRVLGALERLFILGLGMAGQFTVAGLVVAAKGLIRWPEIKAQSESGEAAESLGPEVPVAGRGRGVTNIHALTEYFLVGSLASWLIAFASVGLALALA